MLNAVAHSGLGDHHATMRLTTNTMISKLTPFAAKLPLVLQIRCHCFLHIINLIAKSQFLRQFDVSQEKGPNKALNQAEWELLELSCWELIWRRWR